MNKKKITNNKVVCVLGMHRSGTSMLMRALNLCGVGIGDSNELTTSTIANEKGHWENIRFQRVNKELIKMFGKSDLWDEMPDFPDNWLKNPKTQELRKKAAALIKEYDRRYFIWGWKDPRTCLTLPFWKDLLRGRNVYYLIPLRNPIEVARSLNRRNDMDIARGIFIWSRHTNDVLKYTESEKTIYVNQNLLFKDWKKELARTTKAIDKRRLNLFKSKEISDFLSLDLWHERDMFYEDFYQRVDTRENAYYLILKYYYRALSELNRVNSNLTGSSEVLLKE